MMHLIVKRQKGEDKKKKNKSQKGMKWAFMIA